MVTPVEIPKPETETPAVNAATLEHVQKAISQLQVGQASDARTELDAVLQQDPTHKVARSLLAQIQTDPARYFGGQNSFGYTVQQGDTMQSLAQRFLDEPLKFYILARYNGIADPSRLTPGRTIKIPGNRVTDAPAPASSVETLVQRARQLYAAGKYQQVIDELEGSGEGRDVLVLSYEKNANELVKKQNLTAAQAQLERALALQPGNEALQKQLAQVEKQRDISMNFNIGMDAVAVGDTAKALDAFNAVLKLNPWHEGAKKQIAAIKNNNVESMHKDAMAEYNKQNLDKAIALWDRVLALLPAHKDARLYRARAVDLKTRLLKLEQR